ncbi:protein kinase-like domain-containing protein [Artemisia annua]|uniref:Protein kinase-like domain-containing protein n=1 Tax=Artemisia annua TaxID=35608 RepID=A0A2U1L1R4_ARTAN|nr:protein kinase-like domain-containing protein [Artemisia annua]
MYTDPEYAKTVMLQILCGATSGTQLKNYLDEGIIKEKVLPSIKEENIENSSFLNKGPNEDSLDIFLKVVYQCLEEKLNQRPSMETVVKKLKKALSFQENHKDPFRMPIEDIKLATKNFCKENVIGGGGFGRVYKGEVAHGLDNGNRIIVAKRLDTRGGQGEKQFYDELQILYEFKHENVIGLVGYSNEKHERVIVYEYAPRGSLEKYLNDDKLSWKIRLQICIDVTSGLAFLHGGVQGKEDELVFEAIKEHIVPESLTTFQTIAYKCLHEDREKRPTSKEILEQVQVALVFQEIYEV